MVNEMENSLIGSAITTVDNPFDPFEEFDKWFQFDNEKGYGTLSYLARVANINDEMSDVEAAKATEFAIDEIIKYDFLNLYKKVKKEIQTQTLCEE